MDVASPGHDIAGQQLPTLDRARDALFLDIDGTIIDIALTPEAVVVPELLKLSLSRVREQLGGALALVSGRTLDAIDELFAPLKFAAAGAHGAEVRAAPDGPVKRCAIPLTAPERAALAQVARLDPRLRLEDKGYSMAVHYRTARELEDKVLATVQQEVAGLGEDLRILCGKAVVEVKQRGFSKGTAVRDLMQRPPFLNRRPIYFGDDVTDEDALAIMPEFSGLGISVGQLRPGATGQVATPAEVRQWLAGLAGANPQRMQ